MLTKGAFPVGIGNDICRVKRIQYLLSSQHATRFMKRILTADELQEPRAARLWTAVKTQKPPRPNFESLGRREEHVYEASYFMAGRFAAKEAAIKAHTFRKLSWHQIEIKPYPSAQTRTQQQLSSSSSLLSSGTNNGPAAAPPGLKRTDSDDDADADAAAAPAAAATTGSWTGGRPLLAFIKGDDVWDDSHAPVSISHDGEYATAVCLGYYQEPKRTTGRGEVEEEEE
ncbi:hypothetical protein F4778DRAFT_76598 [Xylariomycetidae sp. FL2044]|nr:hypothetical protein F4778DRAFT_76598 [Xylariomycetidae sp. FL2044]